MGLNFCFRFCPTPSRAAPLRDNAVCRASGLERQLPQKLAGLSRNGFLPASMPQAQMTRPGSANEIGQELIQSALPQNQAQSRADIANPGTASSPAGLDVAPGRSRLQSGAGKSNAVRKWDGVRRYPRQGFDVPPGWKQSGRPLQRRAACSDRRHPAHSRRK